MASVYVLLISFRSHLWLDILHFTLCILLITNLSSSNPGHNPSLPRIEIGTGGDG